MLRSVDVYGDSAVSHRHLDAVRRYGTDDVRFARGCTHNIMSLPRSTQFLLSSKVFACPT